MTGAGRFYESISDNGTLSDREMVACFVYYLTEEKGLVATATSINACFTEADLRPPKRTAAYLSEGLNSKTPLFVKTDRGYKLHRRKREEVATRLGARRPALETKSELWQLQEKFPAGSKKVFLAEVIKCVEIGANRAAIVMCWLLAIDHLYDVVLKSHLPAFNAELAKVSDKRVRVAAIKTKDDFSDIPESKFIELLRSAGTISNDVRKILDTKLGVRNSAAHPSGVSIKASKLVDFVDDLIENVILKYPA